MSATRREKVTGRVLALDRSLEDTLPYLFSLLGIVEGDDPLAQMDGQIRKRRTLEAIKRIVLRESLNQPLMVIFEDLHWIDEQTQELLNLLADSIGTAKIPAAGELSSRVLASVEQQDLLHAAAARPARQGERRGDALGAAGRRQGSGSAQAADHRADRGHSLLHGRDRAGAVRRWRAAAQRRGEARQVDERELKIPATVQAMLASRIDRLPAEEKELLQTLAVIGREFPLGLVQRVTRKPDDELERMLSRLQAGEFIYEQPAAGDVEYIFKHALTQEVAYNSLLIERRKLLHERAGQALESMFAEQLDDHLDELAHHYSRSDNVRPRRSSTSVARASRRCSVRLSRKLLHTSRTPWSGSRSYLPMRRVTAGRSPSVRVWPT